MMSKSSLIFLILSLMLAVSCSSSKNKESVPEPVAHTSIQKDYEVRDASLNLRPIWMGDTVAWAKQSGDLAKYRYFSYETEPKVSREAACELSQANARSEIAHEIATFIDKAVGNSMAGSASVDPNSPKMQALREFMEVTLAEKTKALIHGSEIEQTYWEKRQYLKTLGAPNDYYAYTCASLVRIDKEALKRAVDEAAQHVVKKNDDPETKENVKNALKNIAEDFDKAKQGMI